MVEGLWAVGHQQITLDIFRQLARHWKPILGNLTNWTLEALSHSLVAPP